MTDDDESGKQFMSKSLVLESSTSRQQQRSAKPPRATPSVFEYQPSRLGRSLLSNDNWRQETMADVRINAKVMEQSDQNILYGKGK